MTSTPTELYHPRTTSNQGVWTVDAMHFKVYELLADGKSETDDMVQLTKTFLSEEVTQAAETMGESNGLGFVIIHPGELGMTIAAQLHAKGSVLCQRIFRQQFADDAPLDTIHRPAVACVWELEVISAEQRIWRETMMTPQSNEAAYLNTPT